MAGIVIDSCLIDKVYEVQNTRIKKPDDPAIWYFIEFTNGKLIILPKSEGVILDGITITKDLD